MDLHSNIGPGEIRDQFHISRFSPLLFDFTLLEMNPHRLLLRRVPLDTEEALIRRACSLFSFPIDEKLSKLPLPLFEGGDLRFPEHLSCGTSARPFPTRNPPPAANHRMLSRCGSDLEWMCAVPPPGLRA